MKAIILILGLFLTACGSTGNVPTPSNIMEPGDDSSVILPKPIDSLPADSSLGRPHSLNVL